MLISCPNCATNFSIPESALGTKGRTLKCAKCGHKWFQNPLLDNGLDLDLDGPSFAAPVGPASRHDEPRHDEPRFGEMRGDGPGESGPGDGGRVPDFDLDEPPIPDFGRREPPMRPSDVADLLDEAPQPIPDVFASPPPSDKKKGTGGLWLLLALLVLGGLGGAGYYFQDRLIEAVPEAADVLNQLGLRHEKPGAGLELRKAGTPERFVHNDTDVLVVRGVIANVTDRVRPVPTMKLVLLDKDKQPVQEKVAQPPVTALDPQGTASFKITLERPDPNAVEVVVVFVDGAEAK
jgi:predicted Zn finger-like uncharacterized protein